MSARNFFGHESEVISTFYFLIHTKYAFDTHTKKKKKIPFLILKKETKFQPFSTNCYYVQIRMANAYKYPKIRLVMQKIFYSYWYIGLQLLSQKSEVKRKCYKFTLRSLTIFLRQDKKKSQPLNVFLRRND